jgi:hypothetical protein
MMGMRGWIWRCGEVEKKGNVSVRRRVAMQDE